MAKSYTEKNFAKWKIKFDNSPVCGQIKRVTSTNQINTMKPLPRTARIERMIGKLTRAYRRRKADGRRVDHLLVRVRCITDAYLAAREIELNS